MLTIKTMPMLLKIVGKLDIKPAVEMLKGLDIFEDAKDAKDAEFQSKLRCRWSSRWLRATEDAKAN